MKINNEISKEDYDCNKRKKKNTSIYYTIILIIFISVFGYSAYELLRIQQEYKGAIEEYDNLKSYIKEIELEYDSNSEIIIDVDFKSLKCINNDIVGWIYFENVNINYPIVKGIDNSYYLNHTFEKYTNNSGSIFIDYRNNSDFKDLNTIIYGHNMRNGSMFGSLKSLSDEQFYRENSYFWILTEEGKYKCEIFSIYIDESTSDSYNIQFPNKEEYSKYLDRIAVKSIYNIGMKPTIDDLVITLSTCATANGSSRFIVHAKVKNIQ